MATIAIVGFGDMGEQMVPHLLAGGHQVRVSDIADSRLAAKAAWASRKPSPCYIDSRQRPPPSAVGGKCDVRVQRAVRDAHT